MHPYTILSNPWQIVYTNFEIKKYSHLHHQAVVAEWLRRLTRNQIPSGSAGSSPADCERRNSFLTVLAEKYLQQ